MGDSAALDAQFASATDISRENTGIGFYTRFTVARNSTTALSGDRLRNRPGAKVEGLEHGMGFILWLKNGFAHCLEGYSYDESTAEIDFHKAAFEITANNFQR